MVPALDMSAVRNSCVLIELVPSRVTVCPAATLPVNVTLALYRERPSTGAGHRQAAIGDQHGAAALDGVALLERRATDQGERVGQGQCPRRVVEGAATDGEVTARVDGEAATVVGRRGVGVLQRVRRSDLYRATRLVVEVDLEETAARRGGEQLDGAGVGDRLYREGCRLEARVADSGGVECDGAGVGHVRGKEQSRVDRVRALHSYLCPAAMSPEKVTTFWIVNEPAPVPVIASVPPLISTDAPLSAALPCLNATPAVE